MEPQIVLNSLSSHFPQFPGQSLWPAISNDTDPEGKTKILTVLQLKLPHRNDTDDVTVKVDNGAEGNILPLNSFRAMFPHALDANGLPGETRIPERIQDNVRML